MKIIKRFSKTYFGQVVVGITVFIITKFTYFSIKWKCLDLETKNKIFYKKKPLIFFCWHNRLFLGPYFLPKINKINALQSNHSDGMMTNIIFSFLKINVIYGSSKKGGIRAFIKMINSLKKGESIAITPDGPKGPKYKLKKGLIKLAQKSNVPIVPLVWFTNRCIRLNSWDEFLIPLPFSRGCYTFGKPILIDKNLQDEEFVFLINEIEKDFKKLTKIVETKAKSL